MPLTSSQLALLVEIQRTGSLARAALNLTVTPPAVSQQLAKLERDIGAALVERGARGARLTTLGERMAEHGARVLAELDAAQEEASHFIGAHLNRLRVGAPPSVSTALLPEALAAARYRSPSAELSVVDIMSDAGPELVAAGVLDLALSAQYTELPHQQLVDLHHLADDPMRVVLPDDHPLAEDAKTPLALAELADEHWASGPPGRPSRVQLDDAAADEGFVPKVPFVTESYDVSQSLANAGVAVALVPRLALNQELGTVARPLLRPLARRLFAVAPTSLEHLPLAPEFLKDLAQTARSTTHRPAGGDLVRGAARRQRVTQHGGERP
ncbi:MAG: LysR family transcriptional regulator [Nocardioidaceae bacterium]